jgi:DNA-binding response OmpR family regulator
MEPSKRILVVDDDRDVCDFCSTVLLKEGFEVTIARSAGEGLAAFKQAMPDLAIVDIMMESADAGIDLAKTFCLLKPDLPVILLSSLAQSLSQVYDTSNLPIRALLDKPIRAVELTQRVRKLLGL